MRLIKKEMKNASTPGKWLSPDAHFCFYKWEPAALACLWRSVRPGGLALFFNPPALVREPCRVLGLSTSHSRHTGREQQPWSWVPALLLRNCRLWTQDWAGELLGLEPLQVWVGDFTPEPAGLLTAAPSALHPLSTTPVLQGHPCWVAKPV